MSITGNPAGAHQYERPWHASLRVIGASKAAEPLEDFHGRRHSAHRAATVAVSAVKACASDEMRFVALLVRNGLPAV